MKTYLNSIFILVFGHLGFVPLKIDLGFKAFEITVINQFSEGLKILVLQSIVKFDNHLLSKWRDVVKIFSWGLLLWWILLQSLVNDLEWLIVEWILLNWDLAILFGLQCFFNIFITRKLLTSSHLILSFPLSQLIRWKILLFLINVWDFNKLIRILVVLLLLFWLNFQQDIRTRLTLIFSLIHEVFKSLINRWNLLRRLGIDIRIIMFGVEESVINHRNRCWAFITFLSRWSAPVELPFNFLRVFIWEILLEAVPVGLVSVNIRKLERLNWMWNRNNLIFIVIIQFVLLITHHLTHFLILRNWLFFALFDLLHWAILFWDLIWNIHFRVVLTALSSIFRLIMIFTHWTIFKSWLSLKRILKFLETTWVDMSTEWFFLILGKLILIILSLFRFKSIQSLLMK